ncbi:MAG: sugar phosphate isomerase/epimerase [Bryobacteraceae bacterium]|nr:sugar phosphate isomerase/epimerase [Bryobacteraceae bacterium]
MAMSAYGAPGVLPGCQTNAWRIDAGDRESLLSVLRTIKTLGYQGFETTFRNLEKHPREFAAAVKASGLRFLGIHIWMPEYGADGLPSPDLVARVADLGAGYGAERLILSGAPAAAGLREKLTGLAAASRRAKSAGLAFAYHNHGPEFSSSPREVDDLLAGSSVDLILDAGHAWLAGGDPAAFFEKHHRRIAGMHLRDFRDKEQVPLGEGVVDYASLAAAARRTGWTGWVINEEERLNNVKPGEAAVRPARETLKKLFGV